MNKDKYVFSQLVEFLNNDKFRRLVDKYNGNHYVKHLTSWNQLLSLMFDQLSNLKSLRDMIVAQSASQNQEILGDFGERCQNTDQCSYHCLLPCGDCTT